MQEEREATRGLLSRLQALPLFLPIIESILLNLETYLSIQEQARKPVLREMKSVAKGHTATSHTIVYRCGTK